MEPERGEKPGRGNHSVRRVHRVLHLHHRHSDFVRVRIQSPEENAGGKSSIGFLPRVMGVNRVLYNLHTLCNASKTT